ncbi:60S ribosomal protein L22-like [Schistocerca serialis cubense]|uniref:60S ribosomal protein L22-like n=1 Tax=Schistocerca serialis cubense TaxID=2023355 RepID=UPI00214EF4EB|nr:60S ribosomal protein L22-like [Schistocerca serialis cubense]
MSGPDILAAATEGPAAPPPPAAGSAGENRQLSSDSEGESTTETDAALAPAPAPAPAQPTAAPASSPAAQAGPSADVATPYSEMRELAIKKQVTNLARILKESEDEPKGKNVDVPAAGNPKGGGARGEVSAVKKTMTRWTYLKQKSQIRQPQAKRQQPLKQRT